MLFIKLFCVYIYIQFVPCHLLHVCIAYQLNGDHGVCELGHILFHYNMIIFLTLIFFDILSLE